MFVPLQKDKTGAFCTFRKESKQFNGGRMLNKLEREFWGRFPDLNFDDPEDNLNEIIGILRNKAIKWLNEKSGRVERYTGLTPHIGNVDLIWDDGHKINKPIGSMIRGHVKGNERYSSYEIHYSDQILNNLTEAEKQQLKEWLVILEMGKKRSA